MLAGKYYKKRKFAEMIFCIENPFVLTIGFVAHVYKIDLHTFESILNFNWL